MNQTAMFNDTVVFSCQSAGVVQRQQAGLSSRKCGSDSRDPLQVHLFFFIVTNLLSAPRRLARARFLVVFGVTRVAGVTSRGGENPSKLNKSPVFAALIAKTGFLCNISAGAMP